MNGGNDGNLLNIGYYLADNWGLARSNYMMKKWHLGGDKRITDPVVYEMITVPETYSSWGIKKRVSAETLLSASALIFMYCMLGKPSKSTSAGGIKGFQRVDPQKIKAEKKKVIKKSNTRIKNEISDMFRRIKRPVPPEEVAQKYWQQLRQSMNLKDMPLPPALENFDVIRNDDLIQRTLKAFAQANHALLVVIDKCDQPNPDQMYLNAFKRNFGKDAKMDQVLPNLEILAKAMASDNWILHLGSHAVVNEQGDFSARAAVKKKQQNKAMIRRIYLGSEYMQSNIYSPKEIEAIETQQEDLLNPVRNAKTKMKALATLKKNKEMGLSRTIIHEGTHLVFGTDDIVYSHNISSLASGELTLANAVKGKSKRERMVYLLKLKGFAEWQSLGAKRQREGKTIIPPSLSLKNADSYAYFCASFFRLYSLNDYEFKKEKEKEMKRGIKQGWDSWR